MPMLTIGIGIACPRRENRTNLVIFGVSITVSHCLRSLEPSKMTLSIDTISSVWRSKSRAVGSTQMACRDLT